MLGTLFAKFGAYKKREMLILRGSYPPKDMFLYWHTHFYYFKSYTFSMQNIGQTS